MTGQPVLLDTFRAISKEARILKIMRYTNIYPRTLGLMAAGKIDLKPLTTATCPSSQAMRAFEYASHSRPTSVKVQAVMACEGKHRRKCIVVARMMGIRRDLGIERFISHPHTTASGAPSLTGLHFDVRLPFRDGIPDTVCAASAGSHESPLAARTGDGSGCHRGSAAI